MSLRARFTGAVVLLVLVVLASALGNLYVSQRRYLLAETEDGARASTRKLARVCEEALASQSDLVALNYFKTWQEAPGADRVALLRRDGTVYLDSGLLRGDSSGVGRPLADPVAAAALAAGDLVSAGAESGGRRLFKAAAPVALYGRPFGTVLASYDRDELERRVGDALDAMAARMLLSVAVALSVGFALALWLAVSLNRPIQEIVDGARRIGSGEFSSAIPVRRSDELGQLAREFNLMAERLGELDRMKDRFLHSVSHEMRAPLSVAASAVYHARRVSEGRGPDGLLEDLTQIERSVERLSSFVNNILDLAVLQARRTSFAFAAVDPGALLRDLKAAFARRAEEYRLRFDAAADPGLRPIRADAARLQQVLSNLVLNAFKYTPDGGRVAVTASAGPDGVTFSVADSGPGIPAAAREHLFARFGVSEAVPNPRRLPSSGLGLSICREIVEAHGGRIWARSEEGQGSAFLFTIPFDKPFS